MQTLNRNITLSKFGVDISKAENFNEALQIPKANYTVVTSPVYYKKAGEVLKTPDAQCTVALWKDEKRSEFIATVGSKYTPLQNPEALRICEVLAGKDGKYHRAMCRIHTMAPLRRVSPSTSRNWFARMV